MQRQQFGPLRQTKNKANPSSRLGLQDVLTLMRQCQFHPFRLPARSGFDRFRQRNRMSKSRNTMTEHLFTSRLRACRFLLQRNDRVWEMLTETEREKLLLNNIEHNNFREDYLDPTQYGKGRCFDSEEDRTKELKGQWLQEFLDSSQPETVVELGPGGGYYTRQIAEHPSVRHFHVVELNKAFLEYNADRLGKIEKDSFDFSAHCAGFFSLDVTQADAIILMNTLHHIPDRGELFAKLHDTLRPGGRILCVDPSHYLSRLRQLIGKILSPGYVKKMVAGARNVGTHHFCTLGESRKLARQTGFRIVDHRYDAAWKFIPVRLLNRLVIMLGKTDSHWLRRTVLHKYLSQVIMVVFERR